MIGRYIYLQNLHIIMLLNEVKQVKQVMYRYCRYMEMCLFIQNILICHNELYLEILMFFMCQNTLAIHLNTERIPSYNV